MIVAMPWPKHERNIGSMARICEALGAQLIIPLEFQKKYFTSNTCRYEILYAREMDRWLSYQCHSSRVIGVETGGTPIGGFSPDPDVTLVLGHETQGIPESWLERCDGIVTLPQLGQAPCINVAIAGSIVAYHFSGLLSEGSKHVDAKV